MLVNVSDKVMLSILLQSLNALFPMLATLPKPVALVSSLQLTKALAAIFTLLPRFSIVFSLEQLLKALSPIDWTAWHPSMVVSCSNPSAQLGGILLIAELLIFMLIRLSFHASGKDSILVSLKVASIIRCATSGYCSVALSSRSFIRSAVYVCVVSS